MEREALSNSTGSRGVRVVKPSRLSEYVADSIKNDLVAFGKKPGDQLPTEPELVVQYDVSRTVIREAARLLVERGLVDIRPGRGMVVADFDGTGMSRHFELMLELKQGSFRELMELRLVLEVGMTEYAALRHEETDLIRIQHTLEAFTSAGSSHEAIVEADLEFHAAIAQAAHNPFFEFTINPVNDYLRNMYRPSLGYEGARNKTLAEHTAIAQAVKEGNPALAGQLARTHLLRVLESRHSLVVEDAPYGFFGSGND